MITEDTDFNYKLINLSATGSFRKRKELGWSATAQPIISGISQPSSSPPAMSADAIQTNVSLLAGSEQKFYETPVSWLR